MTTPTDRLRAEVDDTPAFPDDGRWVRWADLAAVLTDNEQLRARLAAIIAAWDDRAIEVIALRGLDPMDEGRAALAAHDERTGPG